MLWVALAFTAAAGFLLWQQASAFFRWTRVTAEIVQCLTLPRSPPERTETEYAQVYRFTLAGRTLEVTDPRTTNVPQPASGQAQLAVDPQDPTRIRRLSLMNSVVLPAGLLAVAAGCWWAWAKDLG